VRRVRVEKGVYRRPDGKLEIGFRDSAGKQRWQRVEGGITAARRELAEEHAKRNRGERTAADPRLRFDAAAEAWWEGRATKLRPATQSAYRWGRQQLSAAFGSRRMSDITATDLARYVSEKQAAGLKGWSIKGHLTVFSGIWSYAARHLGLTGENPVRLLDRVERPSRADERPKRVLSADELCRLIEAVDESYRLLFEFAAETGARLSEALGLAWGNLDIEAQTVTFTHQLSRRHERVPLKTARSRRCLEITPGLAAKLAAHKLASVAATGPHDLVFLSRRGVALDQRTIGNRVLARAVKRAGLEAVERNGEVVEPAPTFHSLRHSHGSALIAAGWDIEEVSARLGHADIGTTQRAYVHAYDAARRSDARRARLTALYDPGMEASMEAKEGSRQATDGNSRPGRVHATSPEAPSLRAIA
jgi:integrase